MKTLAMSVMRALLLLLASMLLAAISWLVVDSIQNGVSANLMGFEREPPEGIRIGVRLVIVTALDIN